MDDLYNEKFEFDRNTKIFLKIKDISLIFVILFFFNSLFMVSFAVFCPITFNEVTSFTYWFILNDTLTVLFKSLFYLSLSIFVLAFIIFITFYVLSKNRSKENGSRK